METKKKLPKPKTDKINPKWANFTERYLETGNAYQSAIDVGFTKSYALVITSRFPDKVIKSLKEALEAKGITPEKIAEKVDSLLEATKPIYKNNNETGEIELVGESPDYQAIDKGITHAVKIRGDYAEDAPKVAPPSGNTYNFIFSAPVQEEVRKAEAKIKEMLVLNTHVQKT